MWLTTVMKAQDSKYIVSTLRDKGNSIAKKPLRTFAHTPHHCFDNIKDAQKYADELYEEGKGTWREGRWTVLRRSDLKVVGTIKPKIDYAAIYPNWNK